MVESRESLQCAMCSVGAKVCCCNVKLEVLWTVCVVFGNITNTIYSGSSYILMGYPDIAAGLPMLRSQIPDLFH